MWCGWSLNTSMWCQTLPYYILYSCFPGKSLSPRCMCVCMCTCVNVCFCACLQVIEKHGQWAFSDPVCLAASVEAIWTPLQTTPLSSSDTSSHLLESVWFACGWVGIKVWLPLFPRDEGHLSFVSKRIMLTIPCSVYTQGEMKLTWTPL